MIKEFQISIFKFKNYLFETTRIIKNSGKEKYVYNSNTRNVIIFGVDNSSSSHSNYRKNKFLILGEGPTFEINGSFDLPQKNV